MQTSELIVRLEAATADDAGLMREAFAAIYPEPAPDCEPAWRPENPKQPIYHAWKTRQIRFEHLLRAEAYESAALTLCPEGWLTRLVSFAKSSEPKPVCWRCNFRTWTRDDQGEVYTRNVIGVAPTPALAICIAALRAKTGEGS